MTDRDIIKAFKLCITCADDKCRRCPARDVTSCTVGVETGILDIIERRDAEIESLSNSVRLQAEMLYEAKAEAIKEFAEKLKAIQGLYGEVWVSDVDRVRKEMEESK